MSWLFGLNEGAIGGPIQVPVMDEGTESSVGGNDSPKVTPVGKGSGDDNTGYRSESYSFDSTALERAAKAAKVNILRSFYRLIRLFYREYDMFKV